MLRIAALAFVVGLGAGACSDDEPGEEAFDTLQDCYDDHITGGEMLPHPEAIAVCCLDHPIAGKTESCGTTSAECVTKVTADLDDTATTADIQTACDDYEMQLDM